MALTRAGITDAAMAILTEFGLGDLSMRRLARDLDVQPSALYWHVKNKQDVFVLLAERIAAQVDESFAHADVSGAGTDVGVSGGLFQLRSVMLRYRDGAEIFSAAYAFAGEQVVPVTIRAGLADSTWLDVLLGYVLGFTALEQNRALLGGESATAGDGDGAFAEGLRRLAGSLPE